MAVPKAYQPDLEAILTKLKDQGGAFFATADVRWGVGSPFSTFDCALIHIELGLIRSDPVMKGIADRILDSAFDQTLSRASQEHRLVTGSANTARARWWPICQWTNMVIR